MGKYALVVALVVRKRPSMTMAANTSLAGSIRLFDKWSAPADRVVILQFAHRGRRAGKRKSAAGTRPFENMDKVKAWRTQNPTQKGFPAELIAQG